MKCPFYLFLLSCNSRKDNYVCAKGRQIFQNFIVTAFSQEARNRRYNDDRDARAVWSRLQIALDLGGAIFASTRQPAIGRPDARYPEAQRQPMAWARTWRAARPPVAPRTVEPSARRIKISPTPVIPTTTTQLAEHSH